MTHFLSIVGRLSLLVFVAAAAVGCATQVRMPDAEASRSSLEPIQSWAEVLKKFVDANGAIDFQGLAKDRRDLDDYVHYIATHGPRLTPSQFETPELRLAHYVNAYNALSMYTVLAKNIPKTNAGFKKVSFFFWQKLMIDGERMSLAAYEDDIIRKVGDPRIHFALNCMAVSCPRLPKTPFRAETLDAELDRETKYFFAEARNLKVDRDKKMARVSEILDFFPKDFLVKAPTLNAYISLYAPETVPDEYKIKFFDYDWTINSQTRSR